MIYKLRFFKFENKKQSLRMHKTFSFLEGLLVEFLN